MKKEIEKCIVCKTIPKIYEENSDIIIECDCGESTEFYRQIVDILEEKEIRFNQEYELTEAGIYPIKSIEFCKDYVIDNWNLSIQTVYNRQKIQIKDSLLQIIEEDGSIYPKNVEKTVKLILEKIKI